MLPAPSISIQMPRLFLELSLHSLYKLLHNLPIGCRLKWRKGGTSDTYRTKSSHLFWQPIQGITFFLTILLLFYSRRNLLMFLFCCCYFSNITHLCCNWNIFKRNMISFTYYKNMTCDISYYCSWMCRRMIFFVNLSSCFYYHLYVLFQENRADLAFLFQGYFYHSSLLSFFLSPSFAQRLDHFLDHHLEDLPVSGGTSLTVDHPLFFVQPELLL